MKIQTCEQCGHDYLPSRGPSKSRRQRFCSNHCRGIALRPNYKGGYVTTAGYRCIYVKGRRFLEHRHVMEQHLGRPLLRSDVIHHKNCDKLDNRIENLEIKTTQSEHAAGHHRFFRSDTHKECSKCRKIKPRTDFPAGHRKSSCDPSHNECKECRAAYRAERWRLGLTAIQRRKQN